jgi:predicted RNase H-like nuclease
MAHVLGIDGCRGGWCAVSIHDEGSILSVSPPAIYRSFQEVLNSTADLICIDIPIGLLEGRGRRPCDAEARRLLRSRAVCVFTPPCRMALERKDYPTASETNHNVTGRKLAIQAYAIAGKIAEVDNLMAPALQCRVHEVHPELCFWALNGGEPVLSNKKRLIGRHERWHLLRRVLLSLPEQPPRPRDLPTGCAVDDYIDALVAAWTAVCIARGFGDRIPHNPTVDDRGLRMEMWFPPV